MEQSPSWEANSHSTSQEIPRLVWNPKLNYSVHRILPLVPILSQAYPSLTFPPCSPNLHSNFIFPSKPRSSEVSFPQVSRPSLNDITVDNGGLKWMYMFQTVIQDYHGTGVQGCSRVNFPVKWSDKKKAVINDKGIKNQGLFHSLFLSCFPGSMLLCP